MSKRSNLTSLVIGITLGVGLGILIAPKKGSNSGEEIKTNELIAKAKKTDTKEKEDKLKEFDMKKPLNTSKNKVKQVMNKADNLVDLAIEKGDNIIEKATQDIRQKAIDTTKKAIEKFEI